MSRAVRLRRWQKAALDAFAAHPRPDFLAVATPGAGKTTFALTAAAQDLARARGRRRLFIVVPTAHLKVQWAESAARFGLRVLAQWSAQSGGVPADVHGVVVTYQQVASSGAAIARFTTDAFVIFDEIHHAGTERAWGDGLEVAFDAAARRLAISGTPFRSDTNAIPFVDYAFEEARADFTYGYADALSDGGVVRPVYFPRIGGQMEWTAPDGSLMAASFDDHLDKTLMSQRLRTALSADGEWMRTVLREADGQLRKIRERQPDAGGLVIAMDVEHATAIRDLLAELSTAPPVLVTSEDPDASSKIAAYAEATSPWIVAVRMVSEGVDIPRLRVGVYATTTTTELFFRQAVGRLVRFRRGGGRQRAWMYLPDDPRLRLHAARIADDRTHSLARVRAEREEQEEQEQLLDVGGEPQMSLFAALAATPDASSFGAEILDDHEVVGLADTDADEDPSLLLELQPPPLADGRIPAPAAAPSVTRADLRRSNADRVQMLVHLTGSDHRAVNGELNRRSGVRTIDTATVQQLEQRLREADRWIAAV